MALVLGRSSGPRAASVLVQRLCPDATSLSSRAVSFFSLIPSDASLAFGIPLCLRPVSARGHPGMLRCIDEQCTTV